MNVAARHMLPVEMLAALVSIALGLVAALGRGPLYAALHGFAPWLGYTQNFWWGVALLLGGTLLAGTALDEWRYGRGWDKRRLVLAADIRCGAALALIVAHLSLAAALAVTGHAAALFGVMLIALILVLFLGWSAVMTRRLSVCLDAKYRTSRLHVRIGAKW